MLVRRHNERVSHVILAHAPQVPGGGGGQRARQDSMVALHQCQGTLLSRAVERASFSRRFFQRLPISVNIVEVYYKTISVWLLNVIQMALLFAFLYCEKQD